jgi:aspartate/methionine/tyrosine aminotransferase
MLNLFLNYWNEVRKRPSAIDLGMGMPLPKSVYPTNFLLQELIEGLNIRSEYQPQLGSDDIRSAIAMYETAKTGIAYNKNNIMITNGALRGFSLFVDEFSSSETTYFEFLPSYPLLKGYVESTILKQGGKIVRIECDVNNNLFFDHYSILSSLDKNSIIFLTNPNNPTGQYYPSNLLEKIISRSSETRCYVVIDESCDIPYNPSTTQFKSPNVIRIRSFSKDLLLAGVRKTF